jgi:hypothetical protein
MTPFTRCQILTRNWTLSADSVTVTPSPEAGYPASNLQNPIRTAISKVSGTTMQIDITFVTPPRVDAILLTGLDYDTIATATVQVYDDGGWLTQVDAVSAWPAGYGFGAAEWGRFSFSGKITPAEFPWYRPTLALRLADLRKDLQWRITIEDADATSVGIGVVGLFETLQMPRNFAIGWMTEPIDTTPIKPSPGGLPLPGPGGTVYETVGLDFKDTPDEYLWPIKNAMKNLGGAAHFGLIMFPGQGGMDEAFGTLYGTLGRLPGTTDTRFGHNITNFRFQESPE